MYISLLTGNNTPNFAKDTVYRFMKMVQINWLRFTTILASRIINNAIFPLDPEDRAMLALLETAKKAAIPAKYVLFDSWFSSPSTLHAVKRMDLDVIGMLKKSPKMFFGHDGEDMSLISIYNKNKKRRGKSKYLLSVMVDVVKDGNIIPAKAVYVRNRNKLFS